MRSIGRLFRDLDYPGNATEVRNMLIVWQTVHGRPSGTFPPEGDSCAGIPIEMPSDDDDTE